ncbi:MAG: fasciclin domain-containing protein [Bacteroidales bacterium]|jgi:uncharacterized surface protein with fasciclin (FAS1) repeats|nr:fasciclin domain-containing protein [Bacteroidales bacterium]
MHRLNNAVEILLCLFIAGMFGFLSSCVDEIDEEFRFTSTRKTMGQYIEDEPDLSEFTAILEKSKTLGLLKAYGLYTCFAPSNSAIEKYYEAKGKSSIDDFTEEELKQIAYDHLVYGDTLTSGDFGIGRLNQMTMSRGFLSISYSANNIFVNGKSRLVEKDISTHNGMLHIISEVIDPSRYGVVDQLSKEERFTLFYEALILTGLADSLQRDVDESYNPNLYSHFIIYPRETNPSWRYDEVPEQRRYGYTILMESNETMEANGITDIESLKTYAASVYDNVYPEDAGITDVTDRRNSLNRFVAYHLIDKELSLEGFIDAYDNGNVVKTVDMYEYIETMCPNTLIEVTKLRKTLETNLLNYIPSTGRRVEILSNFEENANKAQNGIYHEVDKMLVYDQVVLDEHSSKRLRFDMASLFPEFTNNNIRGQKHTLPCKHVWFPHNYIERVKATPQTTLGYVESNERLMNYQGDELFMDVKPGNLYEFTITTLPVPAGTYEVRFGYLTNYGRGVCQFYFDGVPTGVPVNLNNDGAHEAIGWVRPGSDLSDLDGFENDKMMRNLGYMKGPACLQAPDPVWTGGAADGRRDRRHLRKIIGIYTFDKAGHHTLSVKGLSGGQFMIDYMEFVPISALENEDIY